MATYIKTNDWNNTVSCLVTSDHKISLSVRMKVICSEGRTRVSAEEKIYCLHFLRRKQLIIISVKWQRNALEINWVLLEWWKVTLTEQKEAFIGMKGALQRENLFTQNVRISYSWVKKKNLIQKKQQNVSEKKIVSNLQKWYLFYLLTNKS